MSARLTGVSSVPGRAVLGNAEGTDARGVHDAARRRPRRRPPAPRGCRRRWCDRGRRDRAPTADSRRRRGRRSARRRRPVAARRRRADRRPRSRPVRPSSARRSPPARASTRTLAPAATSSRTTLAPTNPVPPVTRASIVEKRLARVRAWVGCYRRARIRLARSTGLEGLSHSVVRTGSVVSGPPAGNHFSSSVRIRHARLTRAERQTYSSAERAPSCPVNRRGTIS